jgi:hypothetical protein
MIKRLMLLSALLSLLAFVSERAQAQIELIVRHKVDHEVFEDLLDDYRPKDQPWFDYTNWKTHLAGFPKNLPADIEIRATADLSIWILYTPAAKLAVIGPEKEVKKFARKNWR